LKGNTVMSDSITPPLVLDDGTVYSKRKNFTPFTSSSPEAYESVVSSEKMGRLYKIARKLEGKKLLDLNSTAQGGGVAEILYSAVPFLNFLGIESEWKIIHGNKEYYECTKTMHNLLQGMKGSFTSEMQDVYQCNLEECASNGCIDYNPDAVLVHDPQPLGLTSYLKKKAEVWLWRCHIDIEETALMANPGLWDFFANLTGEYDAAIFSAAHYVVSRWPLPKFIIPPFIDPLSEKNRELTEDEINRVLEKYHIDRRIPVIVQIGRFDPWKGIDRTIAAFRLVRKEKKCQLIIAGGLASDDPEGSGILAHIYEDTKKDKDIHVLELSLEDRLHNYREVNALQRAASVIIQPSTREGFGLVITEGLWKSKPVIASSAGAIPLQIIDGETGYFYTTPQKTADKILALLEHPDRAEKMGSRGKEYVREHFLLPDRVADYLATANMTLNGLVGKNVCTDCIISFHPWFKLSKRERIPGLTS
jgi:trehalose synthase